MKNDYWLHVFWDEPLVGLSACAAFIGLIVFLLRRNKGNGSGGGGGDGGGGGGD